MGPFLRFFIFFSLIFSIGFANEFSILEIITKKRDKNELTKKEINYFVQKYTKGDIPDYRGTYLCHKD